MHADDAIYFILLLAVKHFIIDFPLQTPFQWMNKGTYGHPGGGLHAVLHGAGTFLVTMLFGIPTFTAQLVTLFDGVVHYHIDWAKVNINAHFGWDANKHPQFWWLLGLDQLLHMVTYVLIVLFCI